MYYNVWQSTDSPHLRAQRRREGGWQIEMMIYFGSNAVDGRRTADGGRRQTKTFAVVIDMDAFRIQIQIVSAHFGWRSTTVRAPDGQTGRPQRPRTGPKQTAAM